MAETIAQVYAEPLTPQPVPARPIPIRIRQAPRHHWARWAWVIGLVIAVAVTVELWRVHSQNALPLCSQPAYIIFISTGPICPT